MCHINRNWSKCESNITKIIIKEIISKNSIDLKFDDDDFKFNEFKLDEGVPLNMIITRYINIFINDEKWVLKRNITAWQNEYDLKIYEKDLISLKIKDIKKKH